MLQRLATLIFIVFSSNALATIILQYHHVSDLTPASTSISPKQFEAHLQYLKDNNFSVIPLSELIEAIKKQKPLQDKTVVITFDDAYTDILENGKPLLDKFDYPYTLYINPGIINKGSKSYLSWQQIKAMADDGMLVANHGLYHDSVARKPDNISMQDWIQKQGEDLLKSEQIIKEQTGQNWRYYAYPYGEFTPEFQLWLEKNDFVAFSQQSGAVGLTTDLTAVPRFPASKPYDKLSSLRDKLNSLPFNLNLVGEQAQTIFNYNEATDVTFDIVVDDFYPNQLNCYVSGIGKQKIKWLDDTSFSMTFSKPLQPGRVRANCTAASISNPGRYYWYSKPWFVLKENGTWYPL